MKLLKAHITEFRSIYDSTPIEIGDITCLVGKNESGKTALLKALYKLNPIVQTDVGFDVTNDYPRRDVSDYEDEIESDAREPATVVRATYALDEEDMTEVKSVFGPDCFSDVKPSVTLSKDYTNERKFSGLALNREKSLKYLIDKADLPEVLTTQLLTLDDAQSMYEMLSNPEQAEMTSDQADNVEGLQKLLKGIADNGLRYVVYNDILIHRIPKFLYFDEYYQMKGQENIEALQQRVSDGKLEESDHPLLGLMELARLDLKQLTDPRRTEALLSKLEAAENKLTAKVLKYWSQNQHIRLKFDIRPAQPEDPEGMTSGMNIWGRVIDTKHMVSTPLRTRSRGFVWFFSFLAWYSQLRRKGENLILLLDEPGLSLHAKAQADLLTYFEDELRPHNQVIYSTHSPFLVDATRFDRVRIVQDLSIESDADELPEEQQGTRVTTNVLEATTDSLFPLQGALGYEINQTLFIGPNSLVVEGVSDLLYLRSISSLLQAKGEQGLSEEWVITPVGGADKVPTFVALIGAQKNLNIAVLIDYQKKDKQCIENLFKKKLMEKSKVFTFVDFVANDEADIEDMFNPGFYLKLVNGEYGTSISVADLPQGTQRITQKIQNYLKENPIPNDEKFNHYRPSRYFVENIAQLEAELTDPQLERFRQVFKAINKEL